MDNPSPLPSVLREISPLINRSVNSSAEIFNGYADTFFQRKQDLIFNTVDRHKSCCLPSRIWQRYCICSPALAMFFFRLHRSLPLLPEDLILLPDCGQRIFLEILRSSAESFPPDSNSSYPVKYFPELTFDASTTSSVNVFSRCDFCSSTSMYRRIFGSSKIFLFQQFYIIDDRSKRCLNIMRYIRDQICFSRSFFYTFFHRLIQSGSNNIYKFSHFFLFAA